jgi:BNR repeat-like domain
MVRALAAVAAASLSASIGAVSPRGREAASRSLPQVAVSGMPGAQLESTVAVAPSNPNVLLAGSNDVEARRLDTLTYASTDGGASWVTSHPYAGPDCAIGDPVTAIDADGRELVSYLAAPCRTRADEKPTSVYVSARSGPTGAWTAVRIARPLGTGSNDKPTLAWDVSSASPYRGRAYVAWSRIGTATTSKLVVAHSDDGGATWSEPAQLKSPTPVPSDLFASLAVAPSGELYAVWTNITHTVFVARSSDGGERFAPAVTVEDDIFFTNVCYFLRISTAIPAQDRRCVTTTPTLVAGATGVTVVYAAPGADGRGLDVFARTYDPLLRPLHKPVRVNPADGTAVSDQFEPAAALDREAGLIWVCFYDTSGDRTRRSARFSCTATSDGIRWRRPLAVAGVRSNETRPAATRFQYGDYQGLAIGSDGVAHPVWTDSRNLRRRGEDIYTTALTAADLGSR